MIKPATVTKLLEIFGLYDVPEGNVVVRCPMHDDSTSSLSVHFGKGVYHCFGCGAKGSLARFPLDLPDAPKLEKPLPLVEQVNLTQIRQAFKQLMKDRGLKIPDAQPIVDKSSSLYGYLAIPSPAGKEIACRRLFPGDPRYMALGVKNSLFWATPKPRSGDAAWIVEGPLDAYAVRQAGGTSVAATLGNIPDPVKKEAQVDQLLWPLRNRFAMILMDNDSAGWREGKRLAQALRDREIPYEVVRRGDVFQDGEDPCDVWSARPKEMTSFIHAVERRHTSDERVYVERWLTDESPMICLASGLGGYDKILSGGFSPGVHIFQADTGIGKSQFMVFLKMAAVRQSMNVLAVSTELPKRQVWARVGSTFPGAPAWRDLEKNPKLLAKTLHKQMLDLTRRIRVQKSIPLNRIMQLMSGRQVLILDYIQRLPGMVGDDEKMATQRIGQAIGELAAHAMENEYIALVVSSLPNSALNNPTATSGKYSGDIGFNAQSVTSMLPRGDIIELEVCKNTRGSLGTCVVKVDKARCGFKEVGRPK